jgi:glycosyltransferase involved in cell wall biosynthesis
VGAIYSVKGQAKILDRALPWLLASRGHFLLFIGGTRQEPAYVERLRSVVAAHGLGRQVRLLGSWEDVPRLLRAADALVAYSTVEGIPRVVMEAMLAGRPVVVSDTPGMSEVVTDEVGRVVNFDDAANPLAQALGDLTAHPARWEAMGRRARDRAITRYSTQAMAAAIQAVYAALVRP